MSDTLKIGQTFREAISKEEDGYDDIMHLLCSHETGMEIIWRLVLSAKYHGFDNDGAVCDEIMKRIYQQKERVEKARNIACEHVKKGDA